MVTVIFRSVYEGMPMTPFEAMEGGMVNVASDIRRGDMIGPVRSSWD
jgi:hypothetical protein